MTGRWSVEVVERDTGEGVEEIVCATSEEANQVRRGLDINLNHEDFFVQVVEGDS